ncbi:MAG: S66 peptidase family protein [Patescibacteria group bacterium]
MKPKKISKGAHVRIIAPSRSLGLLSEDVKNAAIERLTNFGFRLSFGKNVNEIDEFISSSVKSRITDLHDAFSDKTVDAVFSVIGGYNSNQLLQYIDYELISKNPKIICGYSDFTALANAITAKTGMITYIGPHFSTWAMQHGFEYTQEYFEKSCTKNDAFDLLQSKDWSDDSWYLDQEKREYISNEGYWVLNPGHALGRVVGGHVRCLNALQGTEYWTGLDDSILILEEDSEINPSLFDRQLQSIIHQSDFGNVKGVLIGRFQNETKMKQELLEKIIKTKKELAGIPIIANVNFGHTTPIATMPIGGSIEMTASSGNSKIRIIEH